MIDAGNKYYPSFKKIFYATKMQHNFTITQFFDFTPRNCMFANLCLFLSIVLDTYLIFSYVKIYKLTNILNVKIHKKTLSPQNSDTFHLIQVSQ